MSHLSDERFDVVAQGEGSGDERAHAEACPECRIRVADARGRQKLLVGLAGYTLSEVAFGRVEARLLEAVDAGETAPRSGFAWLFAPLALSVLALVLWAPWSAPRPSAPVVIAPEARPARAPVAPVPLTVLANAGRAQAKAGEGPWRELTAGEVLSSETALSGGPVLLAAASGPELAIQVHGTVALFGPATATLGAGRLAVRVEERPSSVVVGPSTLEASSALYAVSLVAAEVVVDVALGEVVATDSDGATRRVLKAPVRARWPLSAKVSAARVDEPTEPLALSAPKPPWVAVDFSALPSGTSLTVDGTRVGAAPTLALLSEGKHHFLYAPPGKPESARWLELVAGHPFSVPALPVEPSVAREPEPEALSRLFGEVRSQVPKLRACYEKWLKANPDASGEVQLVLSVTAKGKVRFARVEGDAIAHGPADCLTRTARTLVLSPLGVDQDVAVPLVMRPKAK